MAEDTTKDGGDISSGFGESKVDGPVSDEKAEQMLHGDDVVEADEDDTHTSAFAVDSDGVAEERPEAGGGGGGGGW